METRIKTAYSLALLTAASALELTAATAQPPVQRPGPDRRIQSVISTRAVTFHNNFTSANITGALTLPSRRDPAPVALVLTGANDAEGRAASSVSDFLVRRGFAAFRLPASALNGSAEDAELNAMAALNYLRSRRDVRGNQAGIIAYGDGVRIAPAVASQANSASFLVLLGGAILPDSQNSGRNRSDSTSQPTGDIVRNLKNVHCPVLIIQGDFDASGTHRSTSDDEAAIRDALSPGDQSNVTIKVLPGQNQGLTERTGSVYGEASSSSTFSPVVLRTTADWLARQTNRSTPISNDEVENNVFRAEKPLQIFGIDLGTPYHSWYEWKPDIGGQHPHFGYWYW